MAESRNAFPNTLPIKVPIGLIATLLEMGDPDKYDETAAQAIADRGRVFHSELGTDPTNPDGALYYVRVLDAVVLMRRAALTEAQLADSSAPELIMRVSTPEITGGNAPSIFPRSATPYAQ
jgi:hypothetical protein